MTPDDRVVDFEAAQELRFEAVAIEATYGQNPYSDYLRKHGRRPTRAEADAIGRLIGGRVRADDDSLQPAKQSRRVNGSLAKSKPAAP